MPAEVLCPRCATIRKSALTFPERQRGGPVSRPDPIPVSIAVPAVPGGRYRHRHLPQDGMLPLSASLISIALAGLVPSLAAAPLPVARDAHRLHIGASLAPRVVSPVQASTAFVRPVGFDGCPEGTGRSATVLLPPNAALAQPGGELEPGDEIALLTPDGACAGIGRWTADGASIAVWADDPFTPTLEGLSSGAPLRFAVWDDSAKETYLPTEVKVDFVSGYDDTSGFRIDGLYLVASETATAAEPAGDPAPRARAERPESRPSAYPNRLLAL